MNKKLLSLGLATLMALSLVACGERKSGTLSQEEADKFGEEEEKAYEELNDTLTDEFIEDEDAK